MGSIKEILIKEVSIQIKNNLETTEFVIALNLLLQEYSNLSDDVEVLDYLLSKQKHFISLKTDVILNLWLDSDKFEFNIYGFDFIVFHEDLKIKETSVLIKSLFLGKYEIVNYKSLKGDSINRGIRWNDVLIHKFDTRERVAIFKKKIVSSEIHKGPKLAME
ncbi:hypothetical protein M3P19_15575 [Muricauda sp. 2012CJ35-5]|uniref:Uncharacterized protein n=1 Tax=Flagellimonas spongiicola TaxID=2942208 RepID=A0ABT0PVP3_9FLAO|nr:hypothetical protein [Allomuricauda spongiicola]MCL6275434.1 hypothetical protein [Allomuricauda spongiicola]